MTDAHQQIAAAAARLADRLPYTLMVTVAEAVAQHADLDPAVARRTILHCVPTPDFRDATAEFLEHWHTTAAGLGPEVVAVALVTAAKCEHEHRQEETVEIVWTGPEPAHTRFRLTEHSILEVVNSASNRLTVVSYAVYKIPFICGALVRAAQRGVKIAVILETPDRVAGQHEYSTLHALGHEVAACCALYFWPRELRPTTEQGKTGILHVKCAVADGRSLFLSSANLTEYAFTINMELGVLITGGHKPARVEQCFDDLIQRGILQPP
jgi:phosphatidylserine/phosphatidylglycerophosphate/cardiolipin synthase-like enzyme